MGAIATAELIADRGAAAASAEFFRSAGFHEAEGVTHTLRVRGPDGEIALALIVREVPTGAGHDATSAYGYPGASLSGGEGAPLDPTAVDWAPTGLVSIFARDRVGAEPCFAGATARSRLQVHDPARPRAVRPRLDEQVRRNERLGYRVETLAGPAADAAERAAFHAAYTETMRRAGAADRYFFTSAYFDALLGSDRARLVVARGPGGELAAAAIAVVSDGVLHYFLGGSADRNLSDSPFKNVVVTLLDLADELEMPLNLGGGVRPGDGLERFKRGFANAELPFHTHELVCDGDAYAALAGGREAGGFFPAYRVP